MQSAKAELIEDTAEVKLPRKCKECGVGIGKGKQYCEECRSRRKKEREKIINAKRRRLPKDEWSVIANFKRGEHGEVIEKLCTTCKAWFPPSEFQRRKDTSSGLVPFCKKCSRERYRKYTEIRAKEKAKKEEYSSSLGFCKLEHCGKSFKAYGRTKYCSERCRSVARRNQQRAANKSLYSTEYFTCRRCNIEKHLDKFKKPKTTTDFKIAPTVCFECSEKSRKKNNANARRDPKNKVIRNARKRFQKTMSFIKQGRKGSFRSLIGCSPSTLALHLESKFKKGMKWENYGTHWHVDHVLPVASFDHSDPEQVKKCWHFSNLQPLEAQANIEKSDSIIDCQPELLLGMH